MENVDSISVAVAGIDIDTVEALDNRTMVGFINKFICDTASFLNQFAGECEQKLHKVQEKIIRIDANLRILEAKLASIPPLVPSATHLAPGSTDKSSTSSNATASSPAPHSSSQPTVTQNAQDEKTSSGSNTLIQSDNTKLDSKTEVAETGSRAEEYAVEETDNSNSDNPRNDPVFSKYFKMVAVGVG